VNLVVAFSLRIKDVSSYEKFQQVHLLVFDLSSYEKFQQVHLLVFDLLGELAETTTFQE
jgi:hypothetical protein